MSDIRAVNQKIRIIMKNILSMLALVVCAGLVSCYGEYDADTAQSYYTPIPGKRLVASVKTMFDENGGMNYHEHKFTYDAMGRIKRIDSDISIYSPVVENYYDTTYYKCNMTTSANYFYRGEELEVAFTVSTEYPDKPKMNRYASSSNFGIFKSNGVLERFSVASFDYSATRLQRAYADGEICYDVARDNDGNVTGYKKYLTSTGEVYDDKRGLNYYDYTKKNKTNFDFSAYFGYWGVEQCVPIIARPYRAPFQLAAFGMLGSTSKYLPEGIIEKDADGRDNYIPGPWGLDSQECPVSYVDTEGRRTVITYFE